MNIFAILASAVAQMILGMLWYSPSLFGKQWMKLRGMDTLTSEQMKQMQKTAFPAYIVSFIGALLMALVLSFVLTFLPEKDIMTGIIAGFLAWFGFVMPVGLMMTLFGDRKMSLFLIDYGFQLIALLLIGAIVGSW